MKKALSGAETEGSATEERALRDAARPTRVVGEPLLDDRDFLDALEMTDTDAALYLGRSRQTLNNMLGSQKAPRGTRSKDYLRCADMHQLIIAATLKGLEIEAESFADYIEREREDDIGREVVLAVLRAPKLDIVWNNVFAMVLIFPAIRDIKEHRSGALARVRGWCGEMEMRQRKSHIAVISDTSGSAAIARAEFGLERGQVQANEIAEHYLPTVLLYTTGAPLPRLLVMTESEKMADAPHFRVEIIAACVERLLPEGSSLLDEIQTQRVQAQVSGGARLEETPPAPVRHARARL